MEKFLKLLDKKRFDIWRYGFFYPFVSPQDRLTIEKRPTPLEKRQKLAVKLELKNKDFYLKREDQNLCGSHKTRGMAFRISLAKKRKEKELVISSTGNAGICAARYCQLAGIELTVFVHPNTLAGKVNEMKKFGATVVFSEQAASEAEAYAKKNNLKNLRASSDKNSVPGFLSLGFELFEQLPDLSEQDAIFIFTASGSTLLGLTKAFSKLKQLKVMKSLPRIYAVQSGMNIALGKMFDQRKMKPECIPGFSRAPKNGREKELHKIIKKIRGGALIIKKVEIEKMRKLLRNEKLKIADEALATLAAIRRTCDKRQAHKRTNTHATSARMKRVIAVITGKKW